MNNDGSHAVPPELPQRAKALGVGWIRIDRRQWAAEISSRDHRRHLTHNLDQLLATLRGPIVIVESRRRWLYQRRFSHWRLTSTIEVPRPPDAGWLVAVVDRRWRALLTAYDAPYPKPGKLVYELDLETTRGGLLVALES